MNVPSKNDLRITFAFRHRVLNTIPATSTGRPRLAAQSAAGSSSLVISQFYGDGGTSGATYNSDYIELFNRGTSVIDLNHWTIRMEGINFSAGLSFLSSSSIPIQPGQYLLIQIGTDGPSGNPIPADIAVHVPFNNIRSSGTIFLVKPNGTAGSGSCPPNADIADFVGFGDSATCFEGSGPAPAISNTVANVRKSQGCADSDDNSNDFQTGTPNPHNRSSPFLVCGSNPVDTTDFFVRQHYLDFLNRQADQAGLDFWTQQITSCGSDAQCIEVKRLNVSAAFFLSIEFQQTGNLVYKMYKTGFGNLQGKPVAVNRAPFLADTRQIQSTPAQVVVGQINWQAQLESNKQAFALAFVQRPDFQTAHGSQLPDQYVDSLFQNAGVTPTAAERATAINAFNNAGGGDAGRASALRSVCESNSVSTKLFNEAFVLMQYFGYLQRNPYDPPEPTLDYQGYNFWLNKLNSFNGDYLAAEMVKAFISSTEYRQRFGP
jgi:hypothetical protein